MNALWLAVASLVIFFLGYRFYSKFIAEKIYQLDPDYQTPAMSLRIEMIWDSLNRDFFIVKSSEFYLLSNGQISGKLTFFLN